MTTLGKLATTTLLMAGLLSQAAKADPPMAGSSTGPDGSVVVIRGSHVQVPGAPEQAAGPRGHMTPAAKTDHGVIVMRPASGSFMRETTRLASEAEAREEQAAREEARAKDRQMTRALQAVEDAAYAAEEEARTRSQRYYPVYVPRPHPPKPPPADEQRN